MTPDDYQRMTDTFLRLCDASPEEQREALRSWEAEDPELLNALQSLLRLDNQIDPRFGGTAAEFAAAGGTTSDAITEESVGPEERLGLRRYQKTRLHASGGMGRIWVAWDDTIGREVAIKVLRSETGPSAAVRSRFLHEARVTGQLEHPGIVPVYEVEADETGQPFYTMRFVRGQTLHDAVQAFTARRTLPAESGMELRELVTALVGVANTIAYAHSRGVLHRDLKGKNVVLGDYGEVIVLDWGLACVLGDTDPQGGEQPVSGSGVSDQTGAGQIIGTPSSMSPEQALGQREAMTEQTDVFGLGVILYEILTGRTPYGTGPSPSTLELARAGRFPVPRRIWPEVPRPLEAICLKAMAREKSNRYTSATEFANDLRRWQADEPVSVLADSLAVRMSRWARRHRVAAAAISVVTLVTVAALSVTTLLITREQRHTARAHARAEASLGQARQAVQKMLTEVGDARLNDVPRMETLRATLLEEALEFHKGFLEISDDPIVRREAGQAYLNVARLHLTLSQPEPAIEAASAGVRVLRELHRSFPDDPEHGQLLASALLTLSSSRQKTGESAEALQAAREALALTDPLVSQQEPDDSTLALLAECHRNLGIIQDEQGRSAAAEAAFEQALACYERLTAEGLANHTHKRSRAQLRQARGRLLMGTSRVAAARDQFERMLQLCTELVAEHPERREDRELLATANEHLASLHRQLGDRVSDRRCAMEALAVRQQLADDFPHIADYRKGIASDCGSIAISFAESGQMQEAESYFLRGTDAARELATEFPTIPAYRHRSAACVRVTGVFYLNSRQIAKARNFLNEAVGLFETLAKEFPENQDYVLDLAIALHALSSTHQKDGEFTTARSVIERGTQLLEPLLETHADVVTVRHKLAQAYRLLAELVIATDASEEAEPLFRKALALHRQNAADVPAKSEHHRWVAVTQEKLAEFLLKNDTPDEAMDLVEESLQLRQRLIREQPSWFAINVEFPALLELKGKVHEGQMDLALATEVFVQGAEFCEKLLESFPKDSNIREDYATAFENQARTLRQREMTSEADLCLERAIAIRRESAQLFPDEQRARNQLCALLLSAAETQLELNDYGKADEFLREAVAFADPSTWQSHLLAARLLARCAVAESGGSGSLQAENSPSQSPGLGELSGAGGTDMPDSLAVLAVRELQESIVAGLPDPAVIAQEQCFQPLHHLDAWKVVESAMNAAAND